MTTKDIIQEKAIVNSNIMKNKIGIIMGVANDRSLAWGITKALADNGADIILTYQGEALKKRIIPLSEKVNAKLPNKELPKMAIILPVVISSSFTNFFAKYVIVQNKNV